MLALAIDPQMIVTRRARAAVRTWGGRAAAAAWRLELFLELFLRVLRCSFVAATLLASRSSSAATRSKSSARAAMRECAAHAVGAPWPASSGLRVQANPSLVHWRRARAWLFGSFE